MTGYDLLVCIRCHTLPSFVEDTIDAVRTYTNASATKIMCAVDNRPKVARRLERALPKAVYLSRVGWGWGAGLYGLLAESILWAEERWRFSHFLSIDYDTLFIGKNADELLLSLINDSSVGLIGEYNVAHQHWKTMFEKDKRAIKQHLGPIPRTYHAGEGTQGGCMLLTRVFLDQLRKRGMLIAPFAVAKNFTSIADDHLIPLFCRMCGLEIAQISEEVHVRWQLDCLPTRLEKKGIKIFHPTKIRPGVRDPSVERKVRNYYRNLRGREPLV